jgi:hypothetical protein
MRARRKLTRGTASLRQSEGMHIITSGLLTLPERISKHYSGTNKGTMLGPITLSKLEEEWSATVKEKRAIYGKRCRIAVGGKSPEGAVGKRTDTDMEPVFFWQYPFTFYEELIDRYFGRTVFDLTPGSGNFGEAALKNRVAYFCIAMTEEHATFLTEKFQFAALKYMVEEGSSIYNPKCAAALDMKPATIKVPKLKPPPAKPIANLNKRKAGEPREPPKKKAATKTVDEGAESEGAVSSWDLSDDNA